MPSTMSSSLSRPVPSSTVITPSLPTFSIAVAMMLPILSSLLAEIEPTCAIDLVSEHGVESFLISSTAAITALSIPRFRSIGLAPAATDFRPSTTMACASTVAVVVPSPAVSEALEATSFTSCAPMFSNLSFSSISLATETPSLVTVGAPNDLSITTLRPLGPRVTLTASARMFTPLTIFWRAESPNLTSLAAMIISFLSQSVARTGLLLDHAENFGFAENDQFLTVDLDVVAGILAKHHLIAHFQADRTQFAALEQFALADSNDFALVRLFLRGTRQQNAAGGLLFFFLATYDDAIV